MAAGFVGGVVADLFLPTPFGLTALVGVLVGYALGRLGEEGVGDLGGAAWWVAPGLACVARVRRPGRSTRSCGAALGHHSYLSSSLARRVALLDAVAVRAARAPDDARSSARVLREDGRAGPLEPVRGAM